MKKTIFVLLCLAIVSLGIASVSANDNGTMTGDFIQTNNHQDTSIDAHVAYENDLEDTALPADYNDMNDIDDSTIHVDNTTNDETGNSTINVNNTTDAGMKPEIPGPKGDMGPKGNMGPKKPHIDFTPMEKDIFHYAEIFSKNNGWTLYGMLRYVTEHADKHYTWAQIALITTRAHNIAFEKNHNSKYFMYHRYLSLNEVIDELQQCVYHFTKTLGPREF